MPKLPAGNGILTVKLTNIFTACVLPLLAMVWTGCQTHTTVIPMAGGYEEVSHPNHALIDEPPPPRVSFQHREADGTLTKIWPSLYGVGEVINGKLAVFVGDKAYVQPDRVTHPRLFAVRSPELPVDITDEVLRQWAKYSGRDSAKALERLNLATPVDKDGKLELRLEFWTKDSVGSRDDWPEQSALLLDWQQVDDILRAAKARGTPQKDLRWKTPFIGERP